MAYKLGPFGSLRDGRIQYFHENGIILGELSSWKYFATLSANIATYLAIV